MKLRGVAPSTFGLLCLLLMVGLAAPATAQDESGETMEKASDSMESSGFDAQPDSPAGAAGFEATKETAAPPIKLYTCYGRYALCISAACTKTGETMEFLGNEVPASLCECEVMFGDNIGSTTCDDRAAAQTDTATISTYSMAQTEGKPLLTCNGGPYADCFNFPCKIDPARPYRAVCECPVLGTMATFITRGGNCNQSACSGLWSAAPSNANAAVNLALWQDLGFVANPPPGYTSKPPENACPAN
ncbi:MAG: hypothetical protein KDD11_05875 [Acidobacteria bacterium]|nr:hypothetical protein [Acidobacteriota bacterium]